MLLSLRRLARSSALHSRRVFICGDNIAALERGRAVSHTLRVLCQRATAYQLGAELRWPVRDVESERKGADPASRGREPRRGVRLPEPRRGPRRARAVRLGARVAAADACNRGRTGRGSADRRSAGCCQRGFR